MEKEKNYEEYKLLPQPLGWLLLILFSAAILGYAVILHHVIPTPPRYWDHGQLRDTPAEAAHSTHEPSPLKPKELVLVPLPEAVPITKAKELGIAEGAPPGTFRQER